MILLSSGFSLIFFFALSCFRKASSNAFNMDSFISFLQKERLILGVKSFVWPYICVSP